IQILPFLSPTEIVGHSPDRVTDDFRHWYHKQDLLLIRRDLPNRLTVAVPLAITIPVPIHSGTLHDAAVTRVRPPNHQHPFDPFIPGLAVRRIFLHPDQRQDPSRQQQPKPELSRLDSILHADTSGLSDRFITPICPSDWRGMG